MQTIYKAVIFTMISQMVVFTTLAQNDKKLTDATLSKNKIEAHLHFLASDELRGRNTPSPEQVIAAKYLATQLRSYGVKPLPQYPNYLQPVKMKKKSRPQKVNLSYANKQFKFIKNTLLLDGANADLNQEAVFINHGTEADFDKINVKGKIAVAICGDGQTNSAQKWFRFANEKRALARKKGAIALVELYRNQQLPWKVLAQYLAGGSSTSVSLSESSGKPFTHIWLNDPKFEEVDFWKKSKSQKSQIQINGSNIKQFDTYNIVGYVEGSDAKLKEEYVVYSAHYDHIGVGKPNAKGDSIYNGARDNAVGTVTVLGAAENLAKYPTKRSALFVMFTGEEKGLLGSRWFVNHSPIALDKLVYCFNSDNGGYNDTKVATIVGLERTTANVYIKKACKAYGLEAIDDPAKEQGLFDRSDNVNFARKGIPAPTYSLGFRAFDAEIMKYYHQAADQADNLDYDYLYKFFGSYIYSCRLIGNAATRPFWKKGDKYYEAGKKLYKK